MKPRPLSYRWLALVGIAGAALATGCPSGSAPRTAPADRSPLQVMWTFEPPERGAIVSSPLVAGDRVYTAAIQDGLAPRGAVYCLDRQTGKAIWKFDDEGEMQHMYSSPCLADGRLYIGEGMHANFVCKLYCLDAATGRKHWDFVAEGHIESTPCVADGRVFFCAGDDGVYCLDAATGMKVWHVRGAFHVDSNPAVAGPCVYVGCGISRRHRATEVLCLDRETGAIRWRKPTDLPAWGSPVADGGQVFFGLGNGRLLRSAEPPEKPAGAILCLDAPTGEVRWRHDVDDGVLVPPAVDASHVYFTSRDGRCYCLDRRDGRRVWGENLGSPVVTRPALGAGRVYVVTSAGRVCRLDAATGRVVKTFDVARHSQTSPRVFSSPAAVADRVKRPHYWIYFGTELQTAVHSAAVLYCLRDDDG